MSVSSKNLPGELFGLAAHFFERLIDRNRTDRHRRVAKNPLARFVNVLAGREIHHGVGAPTGGPGHLLDFLVDRRAHRRVADVRVDLHEEIAADDHRLALGVIDVGRNDRAPASDLAADELGRDVLPQRDELHLRCNLAALRVVHLRDVRSGPRSLRAARSRKPQLVELGHRVAAATVERGGAFELDGVAASGDPRLSQGR